MGLDTLVRRAPTTPVVAATVSCGGSRSVFRTAAHIKTVSACNDTLDRFPGGRVAGQWGVIHALLILKTDGLFVLGKGYGLVNVSRHA